MAFAESRLRHDDNTLTRTPDLVRWGPVIAGVVIGLGFFALLNTLWLAIAHSGGGGWVSGNLAWFVGITAAVSLLLAGLIAGMMAGVRGALAGLVNGICAWALLFILSLTAVLPGAVNLTTMLGGELQQEVARFTPDLALWTGFWSLLAGLVLAAAGGILGGRMRRPVLTGERRSSEEPPTAPVPAPRQGPDDIEQRTQVVETEAQPGKR
jgi:hypothetical protein